MRARGVRADDPVMPRSTSLLTAAALAVAAAAVASGCGSTGGEPPVRTTPSADELALHPRLAAPELVRVDLVGDQLGAHDTVRFATDGSAVIVKAYGGGGYVTERCALAAEELRSLQRAVDRLPVDDPTPKPSRTRPKGMYVPRPYFAVTHAGHSDSFSADAMPADGARIARHTVRLLGAREGSCRRMIQRFHAG
jgi:hypothetical protein